MPIKFLCENCGQVLSVAERKAGRKANCPKCAEPLVVPEPEEARRQLAERRAQRATVSEDDEDELDPYTQFAVYDVEDEMELVYESETEPQADAQPVEQNLVAVPRIVLYVQGILLGVVALVAFALGVIVGGSGDDSQTAEQPIPCAIDGTVTITTSTFQIVPDEGAQVFALPVDRTPETLATIEGLRPEDTPPDSDHQGLAALRSIRGAYARTNAQGEFRLSLPDVGDYYLLIVSRSADRSGNERIPLADVAKLGAYFEAPAGDLVGDKRYSFQRQRVTGNMPLEVVLK